MPHLTDPEDLVSHWKEKCERYRAALERIAALYTYGTVSQKAGDIAREALRE